MDAFGEAIVRYQRPVSMIGGFLKPKEGGQDGR